MGRTLGSGGWDSIEQESLGIIVTMITLANTYVATSSDCS